MKPPVDKSEIRVRYGNGTHIARCQGKTASATAGPNFAAAAVAKKVMGKSCTVVRVSGAEYGRELWKIVEENACVTR